MNKLQLLAVPIAMLLFTGASAQETDPARDISRDWAAQQAQRVENQARMDVLMETMTDEMAAIRATENRKDREALMIKHREHMLEAMSLMRGINGKHMREVMAEHTGPGMKKGMGMDSQQQMHKSMDASSPHPGMNNEQRLRDLEIRMDMMSVMMESLMQVDTH